VAILVGATASADERALGVTSSQALQPYAFWKQWAVKSAVTVAVALAAGPLLASFLEAVFPLIGDSGPWVGPRLRLAGLASAFILDRTVAVGSGLAITALALVALHVSTLSASGLRALLFALPLCLGLSSFYGLAYATTFRLETTLFLPNATGPVWWRGLPTVQRSDFAWSQSAAEWTGIVMLAGLLATVIALGMRNHRSAEQSRRLAWRQVLGLAVYAIVAGALVRAVPSVVLWYMLTH
jgi:hypothetical protein